MLLRRIGGSAVRRFLLWLRVVGVVDFGVVGDLRLRLLRVVL
jgi:hypothetical protein